MAARRDRERRRPSGDSRSYRFATPESAVEPEEAVGETTTGATDTPTDRQPRGRRVNSPDPRKTTVPPRGGARPAVLPFSAYAATEYAYVGRDLRRVGLVIGSLLVILILLNFVLPH